MPALAPGVPDDYYQRIFDVEEDHWWHLGMRRIAQMLLAEYPERRRSTLLDAGCGTGGFLRWALDHELADSVAGLDIAGSALELARVRAPEATLRAGTLAAIPFGSDSFDLVVAMDVLQHVPEEDLQQSLSELRRVLAPQGVLLVRTNGARTHRRPRTDWRVFDRSTLADCLTRAGFVCERLTYVNVLGSLAAAIKGHAPRPPTTSTHGVPSSTSRIRTAVGTWSLALEARYLSRRGRSLPYGHTLYAVGRSS